MGPLPRFKIMALPLTGHKNWANEGITIDQSLGILGIQSEGEGKYGGGTHRF